MKVNLKEKKLTDLREKISETLKRAVSNVSVDHPDRLKEITRLQKEYLKAEGIEIETAM